MKHEEKESMDSRMYCILLLIICTVLSLRIEKMMRIEVETVRAVQCEEEGMTDMVKIPLSCYKQEENGSFVLFFAEEREGLFGKEWVVQKEESDPLMEEGNMSLVPKSPFLTISSGQGKS